MTDILINFYAVGYRRNKSAHTTVFREGKSQWHHQKEEVGTLARQRWQTDIEYIDNGFTDDWFYASNFDIVGIFSC